MIKEFLFSKRFFARTDPSEPRTKQEFRNRMLAAFMGVWGGRDHLSPEGAIQVIVREMSHDQPPVLGREEAIRQILDEANKPHKSSPAKSSD